MSDAWTSQVEWMRADGTVGLLSELEAEELWSVEAALASGADEDEPVPGQPGIVKAGKAIKAALARARKETTEKTKGTKGTSGTSEPLRPADEDKSSPRPKVVDVAPGLGKAAAALQVPPGYNVTDSGVWRVLEEDKPPSQIASSPLAIIERAKEMNGRYLALGSLGRPPRAVSGSADPRSRGGAREHAPIAVRLRLRPGRNRRRSRPRGRCAVPRGGATRAGLGRGRTSRRARSGNVGLGSRAGCSRSTARSSRGPRVASSRSAG